MRSRGLVGRRRELSAILELVAAVDDGASRVLVLSGEAGIGKTALLRAVEDAAPHPRLLKVVAVESEMELAFAGVHQLCLPLLDSIAALPEPQAAALRVTFGLTQGPAPDQFLVGLGVLGLLAEAARRQPLLCMIEDAQWLDSASLLTLSFVARRVLAESIGLIFTTRAPGPALHGLPQLVLPPLGPSEARTLLDSVVPGSLDQRVREQILAETRGNPLQLMEMRREVEHASLAGGFGLPGALALTHDAQALFSMRAAALPDTERLFLILAAADPTGDRLLLRRASVILGLPHDVGSGAVAAHLMDLGTRTRFHHPLARTAAYQLAAPKQRRAAHRALAEATDPERDPDRRAWHRALSMEGPDEEVASELEGAAGRAELRGGLAAAAAFLERSAMLTAEEPERARRAVSAAQSKCRAGYPQAARDLLALASTGLMREDDRARAELLDAQLDVAVSWAGDVPERLLALAHRLVAVNPAFAQMVHLEAILAAAVAGPFAGEGSDLSSTICAASPHRNSTRNPPEAGTRLRPPMDQLARLLDGVADITVFPDRGLRWFSLAGLVALDGWDLPAWNKITQQHLDLCRQLGAVTDLPIALSRRIFVCIARGNLSSAQNTLDELQATTTAIDSPRGLWQSAWMAVVAARGDAGTLDGLAARAVPEAVERGEGGVLAIAHWARAVLENGRGRYLAAAAAAEQASRSAGDVFVRNVALGELVEALAYSDQAEQAQVACHRLAESVDEFGPDWGRGVLARSRALVAGDTEAEELHRTAVALLAQAGADADLARAHLVHGEWLRRRRRRSEARGALRTAQQMFQTIGMTAFAERASRELWATGENGARSAGAQTTGLTPQETHIAGLASQGLSNPEIGARLFISARTVEYHLSKVFTKLAITSRTQLDAVIDWTP